MTITLDQILQLLEWTIGILSVAFTAGAGMAMRIMWKLRQIETLQKRQEEHSEELDRVTTELISLNRKIMDLNDRQEREIHDLAIVVARMDQKLDMLTPRIVA